MFAADLAASHGPGAVTMQAVGRRSGAGNGSLYHQFESRGGLLSSVWVLALERFQNDWWAAVQHQYDVGEIAAFVVRWARANRTFAKVLLMHRAEDFLSDQVPIGISAEVKRLDDLTRDRWKTLCVRLLGTSSSIAMQTAHFALAAIPIAALRAPLSNEGLISTHLENLVRRAAISVMENAAEKPLKKSTEKSND